jgi:hypothetical protein
MKADNPKAILMGEGWEMLSSQVLDAGWVWVPPDNPEVFRYTLPWAGAATAVDVDMAKASEYFVLGLHLAIVARGLENGKMLSDFPEFAQHVARLASLRAKTERFWVDGTFQDDIGLRVSEAFGKVYLTGEEVAVMVANPTDKTADAGFELDARHYGIAGASYTAVSPGESSRVDSDATEKGTLLIGSKKLAPNEVVALVFKRKEQLNLPHETAAL